MSPVRSLLVVAGLFVSVAGLERIPALQFRPSRFLRRSLATDAASSKVHGILPDPAMAFANLGAFDFKSHWLA